MTPEELFRAVADYVAEHQGKAGQQDFFRAIHRQALKGMGLVNDADIQATGEAGVLRYIQGELSRRGVADSDVVIVDAGANVGVYTAAALDRFPAATVWSFEPSPTAFRALQGTAARYPGRCRPVNLGLSERAGAATLRADKPGSTLASLHVRPIEEFRDGNGEAVRLATLDGFCTEAGIDRIHFLKIDVEGHEIAVLDGARGLLERRAVDFVQFEFGGCNLDSRTFLRDFWSRLHGFAVCKIVKDGLYRLSGYSEFDEIFAYQNFLAIRQ
ncbi:FkbM family methyltransferase [Azospirillum brasilense]|uniref:FkbM family methyltransferase n=1 Tax=Azospirillum brasilense TaxID=192 RepID=A0A560CS09_AZOBR|nr:FkbM family methyltransferase [Azospirillum brasilense]TWA87648.1 FkbM family methyltransferase [Azospirillum brasilense]